MPTSSNVPKVPAKVRRRIRIAYYCLHIISVVISIALIVLAYFSTDFETKISFLELNITKVISILFYFVGGSIIFATAFGILGMTFENPYLWIIYSMIMSIICLASMAGAASALDQQTSAIKTVMRDLLGSYKDGTRSTITDPVVREKVDRFQNEFECCGVDSYTDWQDVEYGRTSLKLPISCCKPINDFGQPRDESCGELCLPDHENLTKYINKDGCFEKMIYDVRLILIALGVVGLFAFLLTGFTVVLTCYLVISKKMDTRIPPARVARNLAAQQ